MPARVRSRVKRRPQSGRGISASGELGARPAASSPVPSRSGSTARRIPGIWSWLAGLTGTLAKRRRLVLALTLCGVLFGGAVFELRTSWVQAHFFSAFARRLSFRMEPGPSERILYPQAGPYDERLGYSKLPDMLDRLSQADFEIGAQARLSSAQWSTTRLGLFPIYGEKYQAGLRIMDRRGKPLYSSSYPQRVYRGFDEIPPLVVQTVLFIENRELLDESSHYRNPAVEWNRFAKAMLDQGQRALRTKRDGAGGSTMATQLEKIRHSPDGRTTSAGEKLRQMLAASLRAYRSSPDTREARRQIVSDYTNSIPLAAVAGHGEVTGLGDGLWAWFGADLDEVNRLLSLPENVASPADLEARARAYRQVLTLFTAHKRPSYFLLADRQALRMRTDSYLRLLLQQGIITPDLSRRALGTELVIRDRAPKGVPAPFIERKAANAIRARLLPLLGIKQTYDLDRLDLTVHSTLDGEAQEAVTHGVRRLADPGYVAEAGLKSERLLQEADPKQVVYSFTLYERHESANLLRVQSDSFPQPLDINEGTKLELGSTAKLRTLVTYLEVVASLHAQHAGMTSGQIREEVERSPDRLTRWALDYLLAGKHTDLSAMLEAAMQRNYSASPGERFFTGGGVHSFRNFDSGDDTRLMTVREAFQRSVNLVFIRLMRDIVEYYRKRVPDAPMLLLEDVNHPARKEYLSRFADREGRLFLGRFYRKHAGRNQVETLDSLLPGVSVAPHRLAVVYRSVYPAAGVEEFAGFLQSLLPDAQLPWKSIEALHDRYGLDKFSLADRGYLARIHPLELWLVAYLADHPSATFEEVLANSAAERQEVYAWLFKSRNKRAQDRRISTLLEVEAFLEIHRSWKRLGYPFGSLVPSYATAIGSSGDRPSALAELVGIVVNEGMRYPTIRVRQLHFAEATPMETILSRPSQRGEPLLAPEIAAVVRRELIGVVTCGTARRALGAASRSDGRPVEVGGKTGTGDNRFRLYGRDGQHLSSHVVNRTATFVFLFGDRFFGTITAYVPGRAAGAYRFTSALPVQVFRQLAPAITPLLDADDPPF